MANSTVCHAGRWIVLPRWETGGRRTVCHARWCRWTLWDKSVSGQNKAPFECGPWLIDRHFKSNEVNVLIVQSESTCMCRNKTSKGHQLLSLLHDPARQLGPWHAYGTGNEVKPLGTWTQHSHNARAEQLRPEKKTWKRTEAKPQLGASRPK